MWNIYQRGNSMRSFNFLKGIYLFIYSPKNDEMPYPQWMIWTLLAIIPVNIFLLDLIFRKEKKKKGGDY